MPSACQNKQHLSEEEFETIKSISNSTIRFEQLNDGIKRIHRCKKRLQLRFPSVFRDGILLQFLTKFIKSNKNIIHFACGLSNNYSSGFYALREILLLPQIIKFNLRINDLSLASKEFFDAIGVSKMKRLYLKIDSIHDQNMKHLCHALQTNKNLEILTFSCKEISNESMNYFGQFCANNSVNTLSIAIDGLSLPQIEILCDGISKSEHIQHLDIEDCTLNYAGMSLLAKTLKNCTNINTLTIGNNGRDSMKAFFEQFGELRYISKLICNESQLFRAERINLDTITGALNKIYKFKKLTALQLPLFIFDDTSLKSMTLFINALANIENKIETLQLFPLFEHLDKATFERNPEYCNKLTQFFTLLFADISHSKYLKKLYVEMIGSENSFFTKDVADAFLKFLLNSQINQLYIPFCCLVDLNPQILHSFAHCKHLISIKDDTMDYEWLEDEANNGNNNGNRYIIDELKKKELLKAKEYHKIAHKQCEMNIVNELKPYIPVQDVAALLSSFCGFDANPEFWLIEEH